MGSPKESQFLQASQHSIFAPELRGIDNFLKLKLLYKEILEFDPQIIYGYSLGGRIALNYLQTYRNPSLESFILESSQLMNLEGEQKKLRKITDRKRAQSILTNYYTFLKGWYCAPLWGKLSKQKKEDLIKYRYEENRGYENELARAIEFFSPSTFHTLPVNQWPRDLNYLYLFGQEDRKYGDMIHKIKNNKNFNFLNIKSCPNTGHNIHAIDPQWIMKNSFKFLKEY